MPCRPATPCEQASTCARYAAAGADAIDARATLTKRQPWCPMFIDRRGLALIGEEIPVKSNNPTGRPLGPTSAEALRLIGDSGVRGISLDELRQAMPSHCPQSVKHSAGNLADRSKVKKLAKGRLTVFYPAAVDMEKAAETFAERIAARQAESKRRAKESMQRYLEGRAAELKQIRTARRKGQLEEAERIRAAHRAKVQAEKEAREAQRLAEQQRKAQLHASKRSEIGANNRLARKIKGDGTLRAAEPQVEQPAPVITWGDVPVQKIAHRPGRYEVLEVPGLFRSLGPGRYADEPASCAARAAA